MATPLVDVMHDTSIPRPTRENATFLNAREFVSLAVSRRKLVRADEAGATVRGLLDPETGTRYLIEDLRLRDW